MDINISKLLWIRYQAQLQKNLLYLAAIADAQPNAPAVRPQVSLIPFSGNSYFTALHYLLILSITTDIFFY